MSKHGPHIRLFLGIALGLIAGLLVWLGSESERSQARQLFRETHVAERMLTAMLEQESSFRAFAELRRTSFLGRYRRARGDFERAFAEARLGLEADESGEAKALKRQERLARRWQASAEQAIADLRASGRHAVSVDDALRRQRLVERFRVQNTLMQKELDDERDRKLAKTGRLTAGAMVLLSLLFGGVGYLVIERRSRAETRRRAEDAHYRERRQEFTETLQAMSAEPEAHELVKHYLERSIAGSQVAVLNLNNSDNRLIAATSLPDRSPLAERMQDAEASSCLAVRLGKRYERGRDADPLLRCGLCEASGVDSLCTPSLVGGEVVGSVLVQRAQPLAARERDVVAESVTQAAPALANLRNLAIAETRAATDALTGLANKRSTQETLKRMLAQATRTQGQLSAIMLDLDHFKQINDRYGHGKGDEVLAAVGDVLGSSVRASDFAGRYGGEEFLVFVPDTDRRGAAELAEKVRQAVLAIEITQLERPVSASFGVATFPDDARDPEELVRTADRALYLAKARGRNRVETAASETNGSTRGSASIELGIDSTD